MSTPFFNDRTPAPMYRVNVVIKKVHVRRLPPNFKETDLSRILKEKLHKRDFLSFSSLYLQFNNLAHAKSFINKFHETKIVANSKIWVKLDCIYVAQAQLSSFETDKNFECDFNGHAQDFSQDPIFCKFMSAETKVEETIDSENAPILATSVVSKQEFINSILFEARLSRQKAVVVVRDKTRKKNGKKPKFNSVKINDEEFPSLL